MSDNPIGVGNLRGEDLYPAWGALTAAILLGGKAVGEGDELHKRLLSSLEQFPLNELPSLTALQLAEMCADNVAEALNLLARAVGVDMSIAGEPVSSLTLLAMDVRRSDDESEDREPN